MSEDKPQPIQQHLIELADRLRTSLIALAIASLIFAMLPANPSQILKGNYTPLVTEIVKKIQEHMLPPGVQLIASGWMDVLMVYILVSFSLGVIVTSPITAYEIYMYVSPALYPKEKKPLTRFLVGFVILFIIGSVYSIYLLIPISLKIVVWLTVKSGAQPLFSIYDFLKFVFLATIASGFFFNFPLILLLLVKVDIISYEALKKNTRIVFLITLIITAIITPDPTPVSMLLLSIPFMGLYVLTLALARRSSSS